MITREIGYHGGLTRYRINGKLFLSFWKNNGGFLHLWWGEHVRSYHFKKWSIERVY